MYDLLSGKKTSGISMSLTQGVTGIAIKKTFQPHVKPGSLLLQMCMMKVRRMRATQTTTPRPLIQTKRTKTTRVCSLRQLVFENEISHVTEKVHRI